MSINIQNILDQLTIEEKASLCSGKDFWHLKGIERFDIPSIMVADGPHGLRKQEAKGDHVGAGGSIPATCFPTASASASSWDTELLNKMGKALAKECLTEGVSILLGPGANIKRSPLCGRNFEYISEDPYLTGKLGTSLVNGIQSMGVGTSLKHFALNNQEYRRMVTESVCDERTLREIYLPGFETIVKEADPWSVMCAYNKIDSTYCSDNRKLLTEILKEEWGHTGIVVTDWGACNDRVAGINAGLELEMPASGGYNDNKIVKAVKSGELLEADLNKVVLRLLELIFKAERSKVKNYKYDKNEHNELAKKIGTESIVLLKNENNLLPISKDEKLLIVGEFAQKPRYQGAGSSLINPNKITSTLEELNNQNIKYVYKQGYDKNNPKPDYELIKDAVKASKEFDKVILFVGLTDDYESEGFDRKHLNLPDSHTELINALTEINQNVIIILQNGSPVSMPWINRVKSVLECYLGGQAIGASIVDILVGNNNPSGKLAETFPLDLESTPCFNYFGMGPKTVEYRESIFVGYRFYDTGKKEVLFPFGHGLSYTDFEYSDIVIDKKTMQDTESVIVKCNVKNIGKVKGKEVVQLYVKDSESTIFRPDKELKGFKKIDLNPNEVKTVEFVLNKRDFAYYNTELTDWHVESGEFKILVGSSSRDIRLEEVITLNSSVDYKFNNNLKELLPEYYDIGNNYKSISDKSFKYILGREIPLQKMAPNEKFGLNSTIGDISHTFIGKIMHKEVLKSFLDTGSKEKINPAMERMMVAIVRELPLRSLILMSGGKMKYKQLMGLLHLINRELLKWFLNIFKSS